jgi:hypothetical protein
MYHFNVEVFEIPDKRSHSKVSAKINDFVSINDDSVEDLKIVYYAGHCMGKVCCLFILFAVTDFVLSLLRLANNNILLTNKSVASVQKTGDKYATVT